MYTPVNVTDYRPISLAEALEVAQLNVISLAEMYQHQSIVITSYEINDGIPSTVVHEYERIKANENIF